MSGSRGEANFVWRCKNCKVSSRLRPPPLGGMHRSPALLTPTAARVVGDDQGRTQGLRAVGAAQAGAFARV